MYKEKNMETTLPVATDIMTQTLLDPVTFEQMQRAAKLFADSGLVPEKFQGKVAACFVGLQLAAQLKISPFMLFQHLYVIKGKIGIEAQVAIGIANASGVFKGAIQYSFSGQGENRSCTASAILAKSGEEISTTLTWATVKAEGWHLPKGERQTVSKWLTMPDLMFRYRTAMWLIRTHVPEVLLGLKSADEIYDEKIINITPKTIDEALQEVKEESPKKEKIKVDDKAEIAAVGEKNDPKEEIKAMNLSSMQLTVAITKACKRYIPFEQLNFEEALLTLNKLKEERN